MKYDPKPIVRKGSPRPPGPDPKVKLKHVLQYGLLLFIRWLANLPSGKFSRKLGHGLGLLIHSIDKKHRRYALITLDLVFGDRKTEQEKRQIVRGSYLHFGNAVVEVLRLESMNREQFNQSIDVVGLENMTKACEANQGVVFVTAHYGNWEILNRFLGEANFPLSALARPVDNPLVHRFLERRRQETGNEVIYKHGTARKLMKALRNKRVVGIVNDQDVHDRNRVFATFFGHQAATTPVPAGLALKAKAPLVTGYAVPMGDGRYELRFDKPIYPNPEADKDEEILRLTEALNRRLEAVISEKPEPWLWMHKRFKTGKEGPTDLYHYPRDI